MEEFLLTTEHPRAIPMPSGERDRMRELRELGLLDTEPEEIFDRVTTLAAQITDTPMAVVSLVDDDRQWFKSTVGIDVSEMAREHAFCAHAIASPEAVLVVDDACLDPRFDHNPIVVGEPHVRFYAGAPLVTSNGHALGTLCVIDQEPRHLRDDQLEALRTLASLVASELDHRLSLRRQREAELRRRLAESRADALGSFLSIFQDAAVGIVMVDEQGRILEANRAYGETVGLTVHELMGRSVNEFTHPEDVYDTVAAIRMMQSGLVKQTHLEKRYVRADGTVVWVSVSSSCLRETSSSGRRIVSLIQDITDHVALREQLTQRAQFDPLTGVPNRTVFNERLARSVVRAERNGASLAVMFLDLDQFKHINDSSGHDAGDTVLSEVARRIQVALRPEDLVARMGGDEFAVLTLVDKVEEAERIAERIQLAMAEPIAVEGRELRVSVSIGIALSSSADDGGNTLLRKADLAMYRAKSSRPGTTVTFGTEVDVALNEELEMHGART